ncbi:MAG TPA: Amuc_1102 family pilus-like protein [Chthoniobacterales bacterium]
MSRKISLTILFSFLAGSGFGQNKPGDFRVSKISRDLITSPDYSYTGAEQLRSTRERWLRVEVQFSATPDFTDELTFKYYLLMNGKVLTGEVTHVNVIGGRELHSVMYVPPHVLAYLLPGRAPTATSVENIAVQIVERGEMKDQFMLNRGRPDWFTTLPALPGFLLNKSETPFAPLFWDRYEQIKPTSR